MRYVISYSASEGELCRLFAITIWKTKSPSVKWIFILKWTDKLLMIMAMWTEIVRCMWVPNNVGFGSRRLFSSPCILKTHFLHLLTSWVAFFKITFYLILLTSSMVMLYYVSLKILSDFYSDVSALPYNATMSSFLFVLLCFDVRNKTIFKNSKEQFQCSCLSWRQFVGFITLWLLGRPGVFGSGCPDCYQISSFLYLDPFLMINPYLEWCPSVIPRWVLLQFTC